MAALLVIDRVIRPGILVLGSIVLAGVVGGVVGVVVTASEPGGHGSAPDPVRDA